MSTLVIVLALGAALSWMTLRVLDEGKPATPEPRSHRGRPTAEPSRRAARRVVAGEVPAPPAFVDAQVRTPLWRRLLSLVELVVVALVVGATAAAVVAGVAVLVGSILSASLDG